MGLFKQFSAILFLFVSTSFADPIKGATVTVYEMNPDGSVNQSKPIATTITDQDGNYSLDLKTEKPVVIQTTGGSYTDEPTGKKVQVGTRPTLSTVLPAGQTENSRVAVVPQKENVAVTNIAPASEAVLEPAPAPKNKIDDFYSVPVTETTSPAAPFANPNAAVKLPAQNKMTIAPVTTRALASHPAAITSMSSAPNPGMRAGDASSLGSIGTSGCPSSWMGHEYHDSYQRGHEYFVCDYDGSLTDQECAGPGLLHTAGGHGTWCQRFLDSSQRVLLSLGRNH